jgi:predicted enzyme related to lactoylglutathione lyase
MSDRDAYPHGAPCWVDTLQPDPQAAARFYGELFGWAIEGPGEMPGDPPGEYFVGRVRDRDVAGLGSAAPGGGPAWNTYIRVDSADAAAERACAAGGEVLVRPSDAPPAGRLAVLADPAGASFCIWEAADREGAQAINEPGAWAMSLLATGDPDGAMAFYRDVFGWETEGFDVDGGRFWLWRLPGYVGGEPEQPVPRDVVAVMAPVPAGAPAAWSVDFWVDDVDDVASRVASLGGSIATEPATSSIGRQATLTDPEGATFTVTRVSAGP